MSVAPVECYVSQDGRTAVRPCECSAFRYSILTGTARRAPTQVVGLSSRATAGRPYISS